MLACLYLITRDGFGPRVVGLAVLLFVSRLMKKVEVVASPFGSVGGPSGELSEASRECFSRTPCDRMLSSTSSISSSSNV